MGKKKSVPRTTKKTEKAVQKNRWNDEPEGFEWCAEGKGGSNELLKKGDFPVLSFGAPTPTAVLVRKVFLKFFFC